MKAYRNELLGLATALALLSMLAFASSAYADDGPRRGHGMDGPVLISERMADRLGLDETQRQSVQNILDAARPEFEALRERVQAEIEAVLTEEQLAELETMKQRGRGSFDRPRGKRGDRDAGDATGAVEE